MKDYRSEKTTRMVSVLKELQQVENETLHQVVEIIIGKVELYDHFLESWDNPNGKFSTDDIDVGKRCSNDGLDMAAAIVNELRILYLNK